MEKQRKRQPEELLVTTSKPSILGLLGQRDKENLRLHLDTFRDKGVVNHLATLAIPMYDRIPQLIQQEGCREKVSFALASALLSAFGNIEKAAMDANQLKDLAEMIIDSSHEDQLSVQDVLLFLKDMLMGKYGKIKDKMDYPLFFDMFERYRDDRYKTKEAAQYESHLQYKNMGHADRSCGGIVLRSDEDAPTVLDLMQTYYSESKGE